MAAEPQRPIGHVSCRVTGYTIQQLQGMGLPTAHLTRGLAYTLNDLQNPAASIPWDDYLVFLRNSYTELPPEQLVEVCVAYQASSFLRPILSAAGLWFHPGLYFKWVADPGSGALRQLFRCLQTRFTQVNDREVVLEEWLDPGFALPPDVFWETQSIAFTALTTCFGLGPSIVTWEPLERGAVFRVRLPRRRPVRFVLSWLASWFRPDTAEDVRSALSFGHERSLRLEREIAERKRAEEALRESEEWLQLAVEVAELGVLQIDYPTSTARLSPRATELFGCPQAVPRATLHALFHPEDRPELETRIVRALDPGGDGGFRLEHRVLRSDGSVRWLSVHKQVFFEGGIPRRALVVARDITERKKAEAALRASERRLAEAQQIARIGSWAWEPQNGTVWWSDAIFTLFGVDPARVRPSFESFQDLLHPEDRPVARARVDAVLAGAEGFDNELRLLRPDGQCVWLSSRARVTRDATGAVVLVEGTDQDITDRKNAEGALRFQHALLRCQTEASPDGILVVDPANRVVSWNQRFLDLWGIPEELVAAGDDAPVLAYARSRTADPDAFGARVAAIYADPDTPSADEVALADGRTLDRYSRSIRGADGELLGRVWYFRDITDRKQALRSLEEAERRQRLALDASGMGTWEWEIGSDRLTWDEWEQSLFGFAPGAWDGRLETFLSRIHPEDLAAVRQVLADAAAGKEFDGEFRIRWPDGTVRWIHGTGTLIPRGDHAPPRLVGINYDITERKAAEEQVRASLREKEAMLKEIHHRVKNNLQVVSSLLSLQAARVAHPAALDVLAESQNRVRAMALVHETLYRSEDLDRVNLARYLGELCGYLFRSFGVDSARIRLELDVEPVIVSLDKTIPCGLLVNEIVSNSLKYAFPDSRSGTVAVRAHTRPDGQLTLTLTDDGVGLPGDIVVDHTPTLGLQLVHILTEQLGGQVTVERSPGVRFVISFAPRAQVPDGQPDSRGRR